MARLTRLTNTERTIWGILLFALVALKLHGVWQPALGNDSYLYLSVAQNTHSGEFAKTSIVHFDVERSFGVIPAPMVSFPPGYPTALAALELVGLDGESAGLVVSLLSALATVYLLGALAESLALHSSAARALLALYVFNAATLLYSSTVLSEGLFTALVTGGTVALVIGRNEVDSTRWRWLLGGLLFGLAYWVRYAGLFMIVGLGCVTVAAVFLDRRRRITEGFVLATVCACTIAGCGLGRNLREGGHWDGGRAKVVHASAIAVAAETVRAANSLAFGPGQWSSTALWRLLAIACVVFAVAVVCVPLSRARVQARLLTQPEGAIRDLLILIVVYVAAMFHAGMSTANSFSDRMFVPIMPLILVVLVATWQRGFLGADVRYSWRRRVLVVLAVGFGLYATLNVAVFLSSSYANAAQEVARVDEFANDQGRSAADAIIALAGRDGVLMANFGQATGYYYQRRTVSLISPDYSDLAWTEGAVHDAMRQYQVCALILRLKVGGAGEHDLLGSDFLKSLSVREPPDWLETVFRDDGVMVFAPKERCASS